MPVKYETIKDHSAEISKSGYTSINVKGKELAAQDGETYTVRDRLEEIQKELYG